jgi:hypothetical protein
MTITFEVKWGSKRIPIEMSKGEFEVLTVADLKLKCQRLTEIEPQFMKLLAHGGNMDDIYHIEIIYILILFFLYI